MINLTPSFTGCKGLLLLDMLEVRSCGLGIIQLTDPVVYLGVIGVSRTTGQNRVEILAKIGRHISKANASIERTHSYLIQRVHTMSEMACIHQKVHTLLHKKLVLFNTIHTQNSMNTVPNTSPLSSSSESVQLEQE